MTADRTTDQQVAETTEEQPAELDPPATAPGEADTRSGDPAALDPEVRARRDAALQHVLKLGDPLLRTSAVAVDRFDRDLAEEVKWMAQVMDDALGIGLAATQVGILHRLLVYRAHPDDPVTALVNPVIEWADEETETAEEGCLSIPRVHVEVARSVRVKVRALDVHGRELEVDGKGLEARVIQHEIDHLDGVLMIDRVSREARREAMRRAREAAEAEGREDRGAGNGTSENGGREDRGTGNGTSENGGREDRGGDHGGGEDTDPVPRRANIA